jgi:hypothetical protein
MINLIIANLVLSAKVLSANQQRLNNKFLDKLFFGGFVVMINNFPRKNGKVKTETAIIMFISSSTYIKQRLRPN